MLEANNWYKVMDNDKLESNTVVFKIGCIFKVVKYNNHFVTVYSPVVNRSFHLQHKTMDCIRTVKVDSVVAELLYSKVVV